jgi:8-oxo-dGTP pyrophosphatase MutT (NUDIX family)
MSRHDDTLDRLLHYFAQQPVRKSSIPVSDNSLPTPASVLIPIIRPWKSQGSQVIFTLRTDTLSSHAGQVSLPGGTCDPGDTNPVHTALRESHEEIGLDPGEVEIIGQLAAVTLPSGFSVTPVVGLLEPDVQLHPSPDEVAAIFHAPGDLVLTPSHYRHFTMHYRNQPRQVLELHYGDYRIWGATASILHGLGTELICTESEVGKDTRHNAHPD